MKNTSTFLPTYEGCIVCGQKHVNASTLNVRFKTTNDGVETTYTPQRQQEGYKDIVHGGVLSALLDETIGWAVAAVRKKYFVTGELNVRFVRPLKIGIQIIVRGRAVEHKSRYSVAEGEIVDTNGIVYAKATGKFFLMSDEQAKDVHDYLTFREGDWDFLTE